MIRVAEWNGPAAQWDAFVHTDPDGTVMHLHAWREILDRAYGVRTIYLGAWEDERLRGVLPLALVKSAFLGKSLVSMPYMDYGGAVVAGDHEAEAALVDEARRIAAAQRARLTLRYRRAPRLDLPCSLDKLTLFIRLGTSEDALWKRLPSERRNRIKKARRHGLTATLHGPEALDDFYRVFATNMRDLGSPVHSLAFFREVMTRLGEHCRLLIVRHRGEPAGAGLLLIHGGMISIPWVSSLRRHFDKCPNQALYWEAMRYGIAGGHRILDLGRSSRNSGGYEAKRQWAAEPVQLYWHYYPEGAPPGDDVKRLGWAASVWQRLPLAMANAAGPWLRRGIPN